jgi:hypothetical protein
MTSGNGHGQAVQEAPLDIVTGTTEKEAKVVRIVIAGIGIVNTMNADGTTNVTIIAQETNMKTVVTRNIEIGMIEVIALIIVTLVAIKEVQIVAPTEMKKNVFLMMNTEETIGILTESTRIRMCQTRQKRT